MAWAPDYITLASLKSYLKIEDNDDDVFLAVWITTVSRNVDDHCGRQFGQTLAEARTYTPVWDRHLGKYVTVLDDIQDITGLAVEDENGDAVAAADYSFQPVNALKMGKPYERLLTTSGTGDLTITGLWGWSAVPSAVSTGCYLQANRLVKRRGSPFGIAGSPNEGSQIQLWARLDPDFITSLKPLRRQWWAA